MRLGRVSLVTPLRVMLNGDTADIAVSRKPVGMTFALNDQVVAVFIENGLTVLQKVA